MAAITLANNAGDSAANPILNGLPFGIVGAAPSVDVAVLNSLALDPATGAVTNDLKTSATPANTVVTSGITGSFNDTGDVYTVSDTTGLAAGDYIYLSHASITDGIYKIATIPNGTTFTIVGNPHDTLGNLTNISYQVAWLLDDATTSANYTTSGPGSDNYVKMLAADSGATETTLESNFFVRDAPAGSAFIALEGVNYTGQTVSDFVHTLSILSGWTGKGGITHVKLGNHSVQATNDWTWTVGGGVAEKTVADAETSGITAAASDGTKYGQIQLMAGSGATHLGVDISMTVDSTGPTLTLTLVAV